MKRKKMWIALTAVIVLVCVAVFTELYSAYRSATKIGREVGSGLGKITGSFIGSWTGYKNGKNDGMIAAQTPQVNTEWKDRISELGSLEVLVIDLSYIDCYKYPGESKDELNPDYAELFSEEVEMVFTVDMKNVDVSVGGNGDLTVIIPDVDYPTGNWVKGSLKPLDKYTRKKGAGSSTTGMVTELANHKQLMTNLTQEVNDVYLDQARIAAKTQVEAVSRAITGKNVKVVGVWEKSNG